MATIGSLSLDACRIAFKWTQEELQLNLRGERQTSQMTQLAIVVTIPLNVSVVRRGLAMVFDWHRLPALINF